MKFGERARGKSESQTTELSVARPSAAETFINQGCELVGELRFSESVRIDGRVEGKIQAARCVVVGECAEITASIEAEELEVFGVVEGDIRVARRTTLHKTARVTGEIHTTGIVVEEGARFKGCIVIGSDEADATALAPVESQAKEVEKAESKTGRAA